MINLITLKIPFLTDPSSQGYERRRQICPFIAVECQARLSSIVFWAFVVTQLNNLLHSQQTLVPLSYQGWLWSNCFGLFVKELH